MQTILIVIHLMVVLALVGVVLLQRSEGGGLGIGGGSGFMTARGAANALTRTTGILAIAFFATSLALSIIARYSDRPIDILDRSPPPAAGNSSRRSDGRQGRARPARRRPRRRRRSKAARPRPRADGACTLRPRRAAPQVPSGQ